MIQLNLYWVMTTIQSTVKEEVDASL